MKTATLSWSVCLLVGLAGACDRAPSNEPAPSDYQDAFAGFWLGQCVANWTGLITEMDKIGDLGAIKTGAFYTRANWGGPDEPSIFTPGEISTISPTIDFVLLDRDSVWGADDDTDVEYIYQELLHRHQTRFLTPEQIRNGWLRHLRVEEENYLWVANQRAFDLMREGLLPPATGAPENNEHYDMIDAQLTTEIFGLYAPGNPELALEMAHLPIRTVARGAAAEIAEFYVILYSLAAPETGRAPAPERVFAWADTARTHLNNDAYPARMYDFIRSRHAAGVPWEQCRDEVYRRYQIDRADGYELTDRNLYCNGCFAAGINFAASLVSLFYGAGDLKETIKIGSLCGWDSDNPTATWGGLYGFLLGQRGVEALFGQPLSDRFHIHRTRRGFEPHGVDEFGRMAKVGVAITELPL